MIIFGWTDSVFVGMICSWDERHLLLQLRKRFEDNRNIKDYRVAKRLLEDGKKELFDHRPMPVQCKLPVMMFDFFCLMRIRFT